MIELRSGNVLLKPSDRRFLANWLKRVDRLGRRVGDFALQLSMQRVGRSYEIRAAVHDAAGDFAVRSRQRHWQDALRDAMNSLTLRLRDQRLQMVV